MHTLWEKAIRFQHPDYDPDRAQKLISPFVHVPTSVDTQNVIEIRARILSNLANRQTDKHRGQFTSSVVGGQFLCAPVGPGRVGF